MKKFIVCLLILVLILPACHAEGIDESQYVGTWVYAEETSNNGIILEILYLTGDHRAFYIYQTFSAEKSTYTQRHTGSWEQLDGDTVRIEIGDEYLSLDAVSMYYSVLKTSHSSGADYKMFIALGSDMLQRSVDYDLESGARQTEQSRNAVQVPTGQWRVGEDIPAGTYSVKLGPDMRSGYIKVWGKTADDFLSNGGLIYSEFIEEKNPVIGKIELKSGWLVDVDGPVLFDAPVTLGF